MKNTIRISYRYNNTKNGTSKVSVDKSLYLAIDEKYGDGKRWFRENAVNFHHLNNGDRVSYRVTEKAFLSILPKKYMVGYKQNLGYADINYCHNKKHSTMTMPNVLKHYFDCVYVDKTSADKIIEAALTDNGEKPSMSSKSRMLVRKLLAQVLDEQSMMHL